MQEPQEHNRLAEDAIQNLSIRLANTLTDLAVVEARLKGAMAQNEELRQRLEALEAAPKDDG